VPVDADAALPPAVAPAADPRLSRILDDEPRQFFAKHPELIPSYCATTHNGTLPGVLRFPAAGEPSLRQQGEIIRAQEYAWKVYQEKLLRPQVLAKHEVDIADFYDRATDIPDFLLVGLPRTVKTAQAIVNPTAYVVRYGSEAEKQAWRDRQTAENDRVRPSAPTAAASPDQSFHARFEAASRAIMSDPNSLYNTAWFRPGDINTDLRIQRRIATTADRLAGQLVDTRREATTPFGASDMPASAGAANWNDGRGGPLLSLPSSSTARLQAARSEYRRTGLLPVAGPTSDLGAGTPVAEALLQELATATGLPAGRYLNANDFRRAALPRLAGEVGCNLGLAEENAIVRSTGGRMNSFDPR
jgi:hypothetical protein